MSRGTWETILKEKIAEKEDASSPPKYRTHASAMIKALPLIRDRLPDVDYVWGTTHSTVWVYPVEHNARVALWGETEEYILVYLDFDELENRNETTVPMTKVGDVVRNYINEILTGKYD